VADALHPLERATSGLENGAMNDQLQRELEEQSMRNPFSRLSDERLIETLAHLTAAVAANTEAITIMSSTQTSLDTSIQQLIADNETLKTEIAGAPAAVATLLATAIAAQVSVGVTPAQMQSLSDLHTALGGEQAQLTAALAGTPPVVAPPVVAPAPAPEPTAPTVTATPSP